MVSFERRWGLYHGAGLRPRSLAKGRLEEPLEVLPIKVGDGTGLKCLRALCAHRRLRSEHSLVNQYFVCILGCGEVEGISQRVNSSLGVLPGWPGRGKSLGKQLPPRRVQRHCVLQFRPGAI